MSLFNSDLGLEKIRKIIGSDGANVHFIGILGAGMLPLARLLASFGLNISGSDARVGKVDGEIGFARIRPITEVDGVSLAVYSLAISEHNEDVVFAKDHVIPLVSRAELLGAIGETYRQRIGIAGSHGKSTTTAMISEIFSLAAVFPTTVSGARLPSGDNLLLGRGEAFIYEACEYKDSFLKTRPTTAVITNVELDHTDYFKSEEQLTDSFVSFADSSSLFTVVWRDGSPLTESVIMRSSRCLTVGEGNECDYRVRVVDGDGTFISFDLFYGAEKPMRINAGVIGRHNIANAAIAAVVSLLHGVEPSVICRALSEFHGIERRCEQLGNIDGRTVIYDYAHHPTEIRKTLQTLTESFGRVCCIFKPHTYSRTAALWNDFVSALSIAEYSVMLDIYPAREEPIPGVNARALSDAIGERCVYLSHSEVIAYCLKLPVEAIVLMGAGDVDDIRRDLCDAVDLQG